MSKNNIHIYKKKKKRQKLIAMYAGNCNACT